MAHNESAGIVIFPEASDVQIRGNIIANSGGAELVVDEGTNTVLSHNLIWDDNGGGTATGIADFDSTCDGSCLACTDCFSQDPLFANEDDEDFQLLQGSPAINSGTALEDVPTDRNGASRNETPDLGAYEFHDACAAADCGLGGTCSTPSVEGYYCT